MATENRLYRERTLRPESEEVIARALQTDAVARRIMAKGFELTHGDLIGARININVLRHTGVAVHSIHRATSKDGHTRGRGFFRGEVLAYAPVVSLHNAYFCVDQKARQRIADGTAAKSPMASIDGEYQLIDIDDHCFDGVEVSFQPRRVHTFVDAMDHAIEFAERVTILGHRAYCQGEIRYFTEASAPIKAGDAVSDSLIRPWNASTLPAPAPARVHARRPASRNHLVHQHVGV